VVALIPALYVLANLGLPLQEDEMFWWVPRGLWLLEHGPSWVAAGELPSALLPHQALPPQWAGGLPDYAHPPLWFHYLAAWLALLGERAWVVHLACVPLAAAVGAGAVTLLRRLAGSGLAPLALPVLLAPPLLSQALRADTDLPLLAACLWALVALADGRARRFAFFAALACWCKEPGVLLAVPAALLGLRQRRFLLASLAPPAALAAWALLHWRVTGWALSGAEQLPATPLAYLQDLGAVAALVLLHGGRWAAWALAAAGLAASLALRGRRAVLPQGSQNRRALVACCAFVVAQLLLFGGLNFLGGRGAQDQYTHVRYLLPAMTVASLVAASLAWRWLSAARPRLGSRPLAGAALLALLLCAPVLPAARDLHPRGPEASLYGRDLAGAWRLAAAPARAAVQAGERVWAGSYLFTALTRPYVGLVREPVLPLQVYGPATAPDQLATGDLLLRASYGEPLGRLGELRRQELDRYQVGSAWVVLERVLAGRAAPPPSGSR